MQTFLPLPGFKASARVLDRQRLGKQRVEAWQILNALTGASQGWRNHPAVRMWRGREFALASYGVAICLEWRRRGYKDSMLPRFLDAIRDLQLRAASPHMPTWLGDPAFHEAHRSNLIRKDPTFYGPLFPDTRTGLDYVWPEPTKERS